MPTILVKSDDKLIRWFLREALRDAGYEVLEAASQEDLERLVGGRADLVLLDTSRVRREELDVLGRLRAAAPGVPVIVFVPFGGEEDGEAAVRAGATEYRERPKDLDSLLVLVRGALREKLAAQRPPASIAS